MGTGAFDHFARAGVRRVVFGHTPMRSGPTLFQGGRSLSIDSNACGNPSMPPDARMLITLVRLPRRGGLEDATYVLVPTDDAPDRRRA